jgi:RNA polymerase sigma factor (sigma-70 family)
VPQDLPALEQALQKVASRKCLSSDEEEDFVSWARLKVLTDGKGIVEQFRGRGKLSTYLTTVALNLLRDYRISKWGKYRASAVARRLGTVAVRLEILIARDGFGTSEAIEILRRNEAVRSSREQLEEMASQLPIRARPRFESDGDLSCVPAADRSDDGVLRNEAVAAAEKIESALAEALRMLPAEDCLILKLRLEDGLSIADVARTLHLDQKPLYRRTERLLTHLRREMEARQVHAEAIDMVIGRKDVELRVDFGAAREIGPVRPSLRKEGGA